MDEKKLAQLLRRANWEALCHPEMEYRVVLDMETQDLHISEWEAHSSTYIQGEKILYTLCYWPEVSGSKRLEHHAFIDEIPYLVREIVGGR